MNICQTLRRNTNIQYSPLSALSALQTKTVRIQAGAALRTDVFVVLFVIMAVKGSQIIATMRMNVSVCAASKMNALISNIARKNVIRIQIV